MLYDYMVVVYVVSVIITGVTTGVNSKVITDNISAKYILKKRRMPSKLVLFLSTYITAFLPILNSFVAILSILSAITHVMLKKK